MHVCTTADRDRRHMALNHHYNIHGYQVSSLETKYAKGGYEQYEDTKELSHDKYRATVDMTHTTTHLSLEEDVAITETTNGHPNIVTNMFAMYTRDV